jgi:DNA repair protein RecN (Recombination protein N)
VLHTLAIRDVILIDRLGLDFQSNLSALTGETGAGKSILLDALGLALGARANSSLVRNGATSAQVTATFNLAKTHPSHALFAENGLDVAAGEFLLLRRTIGVDGRSRAFINDQPVSAGLLRKVGATLVDIHGQFENQRLMDVTTHSQLLDAYGGLSDDVETVATVYRSWQDTVAARRAAELDVERARRDEDYLRHGLDELTKADPKPGEEAFLAETRAVLMHTEKIIESLNAASNELQKGKGADGALNAAARHLEKVAPLAGGALDGAIAALEGAATEASEAILQVVGASQVLDLDPGRLDAAEERLFALRALARKYSVAVDSLAGLRQRMADQLAAIEDGGAALAVLAQREAEQRAGYISAAERLGKARRSTAKKLDTAVSVELEPLRLGGACFSAIIEPLDNTEWGAAGQERVIFRVSTNPGQEPGSLSRISSGGELARFMLALKMVLAHADPVPTLVFDEVDSGIGGAVAAAVGERLARLAEDFQVLVVTHSPQVAARAEHHLRVSKFLVNPGTVTTVEALGPSDRQEEIARMLAGERITAGARAAAASLLRGQAG